MGVKQPQEPQAQRSEPWFPPRPQRTARPALVRFLVWIAVLCGPAGIFVQLTWGGPTEPQTEPERTGQEGDLSALAVAGWSERVITAYLEGDIDTVRLAVPTASDRQLESLPDPAAASQSRVSTVGVEQTGGQWTVTVAVYPPREDPSTPSVRHLQLTAQGDGTSWSALSLPAEVGTWVAEPPALAYSSRKLADSPLTDAIQGWAAAYLTGEGELDRYLAPHTTYPPLSTTHTTVEIDAVFPASEDEDLAAMPPEDGDAISVLVDLRVANTQEQSWPMSYALELTSRSQRWEISAVAIPPLT